jgi:TetR/AcrR family transcriptional regulator, regulator of cefoperazone and chloramphenicol sensitivity
MTPAAGPVVSAVASNDAQTRERLLKAAEQLFAQRGFKAVTVREICDAARANVAAVNYHFGDKLGLYRQVMQGAIDAMCATTESARQAGAGQAPEEQLRRFVFVFLHRLMGAAGGTIHQLIHREMRDPTPALDAIIDQGIRPRIEYLSGVIAAMIGCDPAHDAVLRCVGSIQSQAITYSPNSVAERLGAPSRPTPAQIDETAEHIARFSIAGVYAVGQAVGATGPGRRRSR